MYNELEVAYLASVIKKKIERNKTIPLAELSTIFRRGIKTLKLQMSELLLSKAFDAVQDHYKESKDE